MYCEFSANSCVVIKNMEKFQTKFNNAVEQYNQSSSDMKISKLLVSPIIYYDPLKVELPTIVDEIFLTKPFRYAYQHEFRLVVLPTKPQKLSTFFLELGPLNDIAELVCGQ